MKKCPNPECFYTVGKRKCPEKCPLCLAVMGPKQPPDSGTKSKKKVKLNNHPTVEIEPGLYSVQYHQHNRLVNKSVQICAI